MIIGGHGQFFPFEVWLQISDNKYMNYYWFDGNLMINRQSRFARIINWNIHWCFRHNPLGTVYCYLLQPICHNSHSRVSGKGCHRQLREQMRQFPHLGFRALESHCREYRPKSWGLILKILDFENLRSNPKGLSHKFYTTDNRLEILIIKQSKMKLTPHPNMKHG